jgi:hypothetical protein
MRWEEGCPVPEGIHEYIGLLDIALGDPDGIIGLFAALLSGKRYLNVQLERKEFARVQRVLERARKAGVEKLDYKTMGESMKELRDLLRELRERAKPVTRGAVEEYAKSHGPPPPRHTDDYTAFVQPPSPRRAPRPRAARGRK